MSTVLSRLGGDEAAQVLRLLLRAHPELKTEALTLAQTLLTAVDPDSVADDVEAAIACVDLDAFNSRVGRHSRGYVEPTEAAWELYEEAAQPFIEDIERLASLGLMDAALATCKGVVLGLYRADQTGHGNLVREYAPDVLCECAAKAVAELEKTAMRQSPSWQWPDGFADDFPAWWRLFHDV